MAKKMEIVFFDDLGFGWLLEAALLKRIRDKEDFEQIMIQKSLAELLRKNKLV